MDPLTAQWLVAEGAEALAEADRQSDPGSLAAATALRRHFTPEQSAAALAQVALRRRAVTKFGDAAATMWFTPAGLEQATRPDVARWRATRLAEAGVTRIVDLGCGLGVDSRAFVESGIEVVAVEADETTAILAATNLAPGRTATATSVGSAEVVHGDATTFALAEDQTAFADPARRTGAGRTWRVEDFTPSWEFVTGLLSRPAGASLKLGPGVPHRLIPEGILAEWVSHRGDAVEASLWSSQFRPPRPDAAYAGSGERAATLLPAGDRIVADETTVPVGEIGSYLHEPDPGVIRAAALGALAARTGARRVAPEIAYLTTDQPVTSPFWTSFRVEEIFPWKEKLLRQWVRDHDIGTLEIKKRGIDVDPAALRRRLRPRGRASATVIITPTPAGAQVMVACRL